MDKGPYLLPAHPGLKKPDQPKSDPISPTCYFWDDFSSLDTWERLVFIIMARVTCICATKE